MMSIKINVVSIIIGSKLFLYFSVSKNLCFFTNVDYNFMKPSWTTDTEDVIQKMGVIDLNVGLGVTF